MRDLPRLTENTIVDLERLERELAVVRERGYAVDNEESTVGLRCVAVPIFDRHGEPAFAMAVSAPTSNIRRETLDELGVAMVALTGTISGRFGYSGSKAPAP